MSTEIESNEASAEDAAHEAMMQQIQNEILSPENRATAPWAKPGKLNDPDSFSPGLAVVRLTVDAIDLDADMVTRIAEVKDRGLMKPGVVLRLHMETGNLSLICDRTEAIDTSDSIRIGNGEKTYADQEKVGFENGAYWKGPPVVMPFVE